MDSEGTSVEGEGACVRGRESEECGGVDGGGGEVQVESQGDVGCGWVA